MRALRYRSINMTLYYMDALLNDSKSLLKMYYTVLQVYFLFRILVATWSVYKYLVNCFKCRS